MVVVAGHERKIAGRIMADRNWNMNPIS